MRIARVLIGSLVGTAILFAAAYFYVAWPEAHRDSPVLDQLKLAAKKAQEARATSQANFDNFLTQVEAAEKIDDREQRCLSYPDIPGTHWDPALVKEMCRTGSLQIVHLDAMDRLLRDHAAAKLDQIYDDYTRQDATDPKLHGVLTRAFENRFMIQNALAAAVVERWAQAAPKSANALTARGTYRISHAYAMRGTALSSDTPETSFEAMHNILRAGVADIDAALAINPRNKVAWMMRILAAMASSDQDVIAESARRALEIDPTDERIYAYWVSAVDPMWGGAPGAMQQVVDAAKPYVARNPMIEMVVTGATWRAQRRCCRDDDSSATLPYGKFIEFAPEYGTVKAAAESINGQDAFYYASEFVRIFPGPYAYLLRAQLLSRREFKGRGVALADSDRNRALVFASSPEIDDENAARVQTALGDVKGASEAYRAALKADPRDIHALDALLAIDIYRTKNFEEAGSLADRLTELQPDIRDNWLTAATAYPNDDAKFCAALKRYAALGGVPRYVNGATKRCGNDVDKGTTAP